MLRRFLFLLLSITVLTAPGLAQKTKKLSGKIRTVKENVLSIQKAGLVGESYVEVETTKETKVLGQIKAGLHIVVKYYETDEKNEHGDRRKIAVEVETRPEYASKQARKAAKNLEKQ